MKILVFAASNNTQSINQQLAIHASQRFKASHQPTAEVDILDLNDYEMPIYSPTREQENGIPKLAQVFYDKIGVADLLIVSYAEYNGSYTPAWKNTFDWMSRIDSKVFQDKPMLVLATSPGAGGAGSVLAQVQQSAPFFGADIKGVLSIPSFYDNFDSEKGELSNDTLANALQIEIAKLA